MDIGESFKRLGLCKLKNQYLGLKIKMEEMIAKKLKIMILSGQPLKIR